MIAGNTENLGKSSRSRERLGNLIRHSGDLITTGRAAEIMGVSASEASKILTRWTTQGWLTRIRRGVYVAVPVEASTDQALEDGWVLIPQLFDPAYVGGWSAAEHWDLTEQIFHDICVLTQKPVPKKTLTVHGISFFLTHVGEADFFGTRTVWRGETRIQISDMEKTILDMFSQPRLGGGAMHVIDCFRQAMRHKDFSISRLADYARRIDNGAVYKRMGFLAEAFLGEEHELTALCASGLTKGNAKFDPNGPADRLITRWRLWVPETLPHRLETS